MLHPVTLRAFRDELTKIAAATTFVDAKILQVQPFDKDFEHIIAAGENRDGHHISHLLGDRHFKTKGPAVTVDLLQGPDGKRWAVSMMHVRPDLRGKGIGKKLWDVIRKTHPNSQFGVTPDPVKDKVVSKEDLFKVYKAYGFTPHPKLKDWMETFGTNHPNYKEKTAALSAAQKVEQHHLDPDWKSFEKNLKGVKFRQAAASHPQSDSKLQAYIKSYGGFLSSKKVLGQVPSRTSARKHTIKKLEGGRLGCSCKDWQYSHSHQGTDCDHIESFKKGKTKMSSVTLRAFRDELEKIAARRGLKEIRKAIGAGDPHKALALAKAPGVVKATAAGSQIKHLGSGSEGLATLVAHPQHGLSVRKIYDPAGVATPELINRKEQVGRRVRSPALPQFHGAATAPGGAPMHFNEYVQGTPLGGASGGVAPPMSPSQGPGVKGVPEHAASRQAAAQAQMAMRRAGFQGARDIRRANMVQTPTGQVKVVDYVPHKRGEFVTSPTQSARLTGGATGAVIPKSRQGKSLMQFENAGTNTPQNRLLSTQLAPGRPPSMGGKIGRDRTPMLSPPKSIVMPAGDFL